MQGLDSQNILLGWILFSILGIILIVANFWSFLKIRQLNKKSELFFSGKKGTDLEEIILNQQKEIEKLDKDIEKIYKGSEKIYKLAHKGIHKIGVIRFNPFKDVGGDQSFAIALLDGKNNGLVISSLYTREGTRIYTKSIIKGVSPKHPLTEEEKKAITKALN